MKDCGLAKVFDFTISGDKIWFTELAENNIGVIDTSVKLPIDVESDSESISLKAGESNEVNLIISAHQNSDVSLITSSSDDTLNVFSDSSQTFNVNSLKTINVTILASEESIPGTYKVLPGAQTKDVSVSKFVTIIIEP